MHHAVLDRWSRGSSFLHPRDARVKVVLLLAYLIAVATTPGLPPLGLAAYGGLLAGAIALARLPAGGVLLRAAAVLPFSIVFAALSLVAGDAPRAFSLVMRSYFSAAAVLVLAGTTPMPQVLRALAALGAPRFLVLVIQFLYRYLFVISEQAQHMRLASVSRGGSRFRGRGRFQAAAGAVAVLFGRSYARAQGIHQAMLARGFTGEIHSLSHERASWADLLLLLLGLAACAGLRFTLANV